MVQEILDLILLDDIHSSHIHVNNSAVPYSGIVEDYRLPLFDPDHAFNNSGKREKRKEKKAYYTTADQTLTDSPFDQRCTESTLFVPGS